jgi:hypothetical protein
MTDIAVMTLTAAAATATAVVELKNLSRMMTSFCLAARYCNAIPPMNSKFCCMIARFGSRR